MGPPKDQPTGWAVSPHSTASIGRTLPDHASHHIAGLTGSVASQSNVAFGLALFLPLSGRPDHPETPPACWLAPRNLPPGANANYDSGPVAVGRPSRGLGGARECGPDKESYRRGDGGG